ncbi:type 2 lanthipeptide synthetase LanM family protein [Nocardia sp. NPDC003482]
MAADERGHPRHVAMWWNALTLDERRIAPDAPGRGFDNADRAATARRRLEQWRAQAPFRDDEYFARRLEFDDLDEPTFVALLGESADALRTRMPRPPPWLSDLYRAYEIPHARPIPVVGPLIGRAQTVLTDTAAELASRRPDADIHWDTVIERLLDALTARLDDRINRAVILDLRVATLRGTLPERDSAARFRGYVDRLRAPAEALRFLARYPVLARALTECVEDWTGATVELLRRVCADWDALTATFGPGPLTGVETGLGDAHRRGREVCALRFGDERRVLYKPRPLGIDRHFGALLSWLHAKGAPALRVPRTLDRGAYGWAEFIAHAPCRDEAAAHRFYQRQGALLAALYLMNANDFHYANLIAAGEFPVPIDLETLATPDFGQACAHSYDSDAEFELATSVIGTMLLPFRADDNAVDRSGLGSREGQLSADPLPRWERLGTDRAHLSFRRRTLSGARNLPELNGSALHAGDFVADIEAGFTSVYRIIGAHRDRLAAPGGPLAALRGDEIRVVFRATGFYDKIIHQSFHPDHLRDALDRERLIDRLWFGLDRTRYPHIALRLLPSERDDLRRGEIPYFHTRVDARDVWTSEGERVEGLFVRSGWEMIHCRLAGFGDTDLRRQLWYIRASMSTLDLNRQTTFRRYPRPSATSPADRDCLLAQAAAVADRVVRLARRRDGRASWLGLCYAEGRGWQPRSLGVDLYGGLPGVILFLSYAEARLGRAEFGIVAREAWATLRAMLARRPGPDGIGAFDGWGGLLHLWIHLAHLWNDPAVLAETEAMVRRIEARADADEHLDVVRGTAGAIVPLLLLHRTTGDPGPLDLARRLGDRLVARAQPSAGGAGWVSASSPVRPLTGFSHGASGFAWTLTELFAHTGVDAYARTALDAAAFERAHRSDGNWADLRRPRRAPMTAWCHGACGIGLSRLRMRAHLDDERLTEDLDIAVRTTYDNGFGANHSLCHGDSGALDLLLEVSRSLPEADRKTALAERVSYSLAAMTEHGWRCGVPLDVETPGLLDGLAGIGYELLRLAEPDRVPSVLLLDGPPPAEGTGHHDASRASRLGDIDRSGHETRVPRGLLG